MQMLSLGTTKEAHLDFNFTEQYRPSMLITFQGSKDVNYLEIDLCANCIRIVGPVEVIHRKTFGETQNG